MFKCDSKKNHQCQEQFEISHDFAKEYDAHFMIYFMYEITTLFKNIQKNHATVCFLKLLQLRK